MAQQKKTFDPKRPSGEKPEVPQASTITSTTIVDAYVFQNRNAQRRIEWHGKINRETLRDLGARFVRSRA